MTVLGKISSPAPGIVARCILCARAYRLVVVAIRHQHRRADRLQLGISPVRLGLPHLADLRDEGIVVLRVADSLAYCARRAR